MTANPVGVMTEATIGITCTLEVLFKINTFSFWIQWNMNETFLKFGGYSVGRKFSNPVIGKLLCGFKVKFLV